MICQIRLSGFKFLNPHILILETSTYHTFETCQEPQLLRLATVTLPQILHSKKVLKNRPKLSQKKGNRSSNHPFFRCQKCQVSGRAATRKMPGKPINPHNFPPLRWPRSLCVANAARSQRKHEATTSGRLPRGWGWRNHPEKKSPFFAFSWLGMGIPFQKKKDIASWVEVRTCFG